MKSATRQKVVPEKLDPSTYRRPRPSRAIMILFIFPIVFLSFWLLSNLLGAGLGALLDAIPPDQLEDLLRTLNWPIR